MFFMNHSAGTEISPILLMIVILIFASSLYLLRKFSKYEYAKNESYKNFALNHLNEIEYMHMKGSSEVVCVIKMKNKKPEIAGYGIDAVRLYTKIISTRPELDNLK